MAENADLVAQFCGITGAAAHVAENYLLAHEWNLERAVDFYLEHPPQHAAGEVDDAFHDALPAFETEQGQHPTSATAAQPDVVEIPDDEQLPAGRQDDLLELARQRNRAVAARRQAEQQEDDMAEEMCRRAGISTPPDGLEVRGRRLAAAVNGHAAGPRTRSQPGPGLAVAAELDLMEYHSMDEDDDIEPPPLVGPSSSTDLSRLRELGQTYHQQQQQQLFEHYHRLAQQQQQDAAAEMFYGDADAAAAEAATAAESGVGVVGTGNGSAVPDIELPEGINLEEARMLEAAMLGIPYEGSIPDFRRDEVATATAAAPLSPETMEQRSLRAEQDAAYEESLALDRAKQESLAAAEEAAQAECRAQQEAAAAAEQEAAASKAVLAALLAIKRARLPPEPVSSKPDSLQIVARMPDGSRKARRFRMTDSLQAVFDFVDVQCNEASAKDEQQEGGCGGVKPGSYRLVTQFPRKVYMEGTQESLQEAGIISDTALFIEAV